MSHFCVFYPFFILFLALFLLLHPLPHTSLRLDTLQLCVDSLRNSYRRANRMERKAMQERLQKRYRPQIPCPLSAGEMGPVDLVDVTQPLGEAGPSKKPTMSRAQQLVKKSHIVTAQQKVKVCFKALILSLYNGNPFLKSPTMP